jgi:MtN3 and saliva related transmembrane protein
VQDRESWSRNSNCNLLLQQRLEQWRERFGHMCFWEPMTSTVANIVGTAAAICSMASFLPQALKIWRERDAEAVSIRMYAITVTGFTLWAAYGMILKSWPLVGSNLVSLGLSGLILGLSIRFKRGKHGGSPAPARGEARNTASARHG